MQAKEKAPRHGAVEPNRIIVSSEPTGSPNNGQARNEQRQIRPGAIIKVIRYGDTPFMQVSQATVRDNRLSFGARGLLAYLLSQPQGWQPLSWHIKQETGRSEYELRGYMKELRKYGYARLLNSAKGYKWEFCEFPNQAWLASAKAIYRISQDGNFDREKNDRVFKNDRKGVRGDGQRRGSSKSRVQRKPKGETERAPLAAQASFVSSSFPKSPESESVILAQLEAESGVRLTPAIRAIAQRFYADMQANGWTISGAPVHDPLAVLLARIAHIKNGYKNQRGKYGWYQRLSIEGLQAKRQRFQDERNQLYDHDNPLANQERRDELQERLDALDKELERKTGRTVESLRMQRAARRGESEHKATKADERVAWEAEL